MAHKQPTPWHEEILQLRREFNRKVTTLKIKKMMSQDNLSPSEVLNLLGHSSDIQDAQLLILSKTVFNIEKKIEPFDDDKFIELLTTDVEGLIATTNDMKKEIKKMNKDLNTLTDLVMDLITVVSDIQKGQAQLIEFVKKQR